MIYLDNASTTAMSEVSLEALIETSRKLYGNPSSAYRYGKKSKAILDESRDIISNCIGAEPEEIYFTSCGTESDNWVINQLGLLWKKCITSKIEHHAILNPLRDRITKGIYADILPVDRNGLVLEEQLRNALDGTPKLVSIMLQNNETGAIQNIKQFAEIVHIDNSQSVFHTDAVQAVGHIPIDVKELGVDMLSASAHKFNGPKGVGFLFINKNYKTSPLVFGGGQEKGMRSGTENVAGIYAMAKALEDNICHMKEIHERISKLDQLLLELLSAAGIEYRINGDGNHRAKGILNIMFKGLDGEGLLNMLDIYDIYVSVGSACNSKSQDRSHVLKAMGMEDECIDSSIRISIGKYNTEEDIYRFVKRIKEYRNIVALADL